jgi:multiple sugar transport system permease protein
MGAEGAALSILADGFMAENPGARVRTQAIPWAAAHDRLLTAVAGDVTPDVVQLGTTWVPEFAAMNSLLELDGRLTAASSLSEEDFYAGSFLAAQWNDRLVSIPWYVDTRVFFYRSDIAEQAGWSHFPRTWEELLQFGEDVTADIDGDGRTDRYAFNLPSRNEDVVLPFLRQGGAEFLSQDFSHSTIDSRETHAALGFFRRIFDEGYAPRQSMVQSDPLQAFRRGDFVSWVSGPWMVGQINQYLPELEGSWAVAPMPAGPRASSFLGGCNLAIFRNSKNPELAWAFVEYCLRPDVQIDWYRRMGNLPAHREAWNDPALTGDPRWVAFRQQLEVAEPPPTIEVWEAMVAVIRDEVESLVAARKSPEEAAAGLDRGFSAILSRRRVESDSTLADGNLVGFTYAILALAGLSLMGLVGYFVISPIGRASIAQHRAPILFIMPAMTHLGLFLIFPLVLSFFLSFTNFDIYSLTDWKATSFVGIDNYARLLADPLFWRSVLNTLYFVVVGGPLTIALALTLAVLLNARLLPYKSLFRTALFLPVITPLVAIAVVWRWIYAPPGNGILNYLMDLVGLPQMAWLGDPSLAMPSLIAMATWKNVGFSMVIFVAGLQAIPRELYEASDLDGASPWQSFWNVTLPLLRPTLVFVTIITTIGYMQFFAEPYVMTEGGPQNSTRSVVLHLYKEGFGFFNLGYASAIAYTLAAAIAVLSLFQLRWAKDSDTA